MMRGMRLGLWGDEVGGGCDCGLEIGGYYLGYL